MPTSNTDCFRAFLDALAKKFASEDLGRQRLSDRMT